MSQGLSPLISLVTITMMSNIITIRINNCFYYDCRLKNVFPSFGIIEGSSLSNFGLYISIPRFPKMKIWKTTPNENYSKYIYTFAIDLAPGRNPFVELLIKKFL